MNKLFVKCKGYRLNFKQTRIKTILGLCNHYPHFGIHKGGMIPHVIKDWPETGFIEMSHISINIWWIIILITKYTKNQY